MIKTIMIIGREEVTLRKMRVGAASAQVATCLGTTIGVTSLSCHRRTVLVELPNILWIVAGCAQESAATNKKWGDTQVAHLNTICISMVLTIDPC